MTVNKGINNNLSLHRTVFLRVVPGGSVISVPDSSLGRHRFQTSSQQPAAAYGLGTNHNSDGHQQVHASFSYLTFSKKSAHVHPDCSDFVHFMSGVGPKKAAHVMLSASFQVSNVVSNI